jgi:hypothetical protein
MDLYRGFILMGNGDKKENVAASVCGDTRESFY